MLDTALKIIKINTIMFIFHLEVKNANDSMHPKYNLGLHAC